MIILAREARGMTQTLFAERLQTTQGNVSKWESGFLEVSESIVESFSRVLDFPKEFFYQSEARFAAGSNCFYHRKRQTMPVGELRTIKAHLNIFRIQVQRLLDGAEVERDNEFFRLDVEEFGGDPAAVARAVRAAWKMPEGPVANLVSTIELAGGVVFRLPFGTNKLDAISQWAPGSQPLFFVNSEASADRQRFTLAHELGHVVMHQIPTDNREAEADTFAAEFLMPQKDILPHLKPLSIARLAALKPYWRVSMAAIAKRAADLGTITDRQYRSIYMQLGKHGYRLHEPVELQPEEPSVIKQLVGVHLDDHGYSIEELASMLCVTEREFRKHYLPDAEGPGQLRVVS